MQLKQQHNPSKERALPLLADSNKAIDGSLLSWRLKNALISKTT